MDFQTINTTPYLDQKPGTAGLRKKTKVYMQDNYTANFVQSIFDVVKERGLVLENSSFVIGGDGRFYYKQALQIIAKIAIANGVKRLVIAKDGFCSSPAISTIIRKYGLQGGFILTASHNPGGENSDFGIKYEVENGGGAPSEITDAIYENTKIISEYKTLNCDDIDISYIHKETISNTEIEIIDGFIDHVELLERLFDFDAIRNFFKSGFKFRFDAMNAVTGPEAKYLFEEVLGAPKGTVIRDVPMEDFGGIHPDPNLTYNKELADFMYSQDATDLGAACDGDGDRNMIVGRNFFVSPGDSLALIVERAKECIPSFKNGLYGVARSMPTSTQVDKVASALGIDCYEVPTGWKFFANLMDAKKCSICGEESFGTSSDHIREKDGLWAILCWINIMAKTGLSVKELMTKHWERFGRCYYQRQDFENLDLDAANKMFADIRENLQSFKGISFAGSKITNIDDFCYNDPVDGSVTPKQGIRIYLEDGSRVVFRLSGTGSSGATLRVYLEKYEKEDILSDPNQKLKALGDAVMGFLNIKERFNVTGPTVTT